MTLKIHNSLTKNLEDFESLKEGEVRMYSCGPTVYDRVHIGNLRAFLTSDLVRRTCEYLGFTVEQVMNITDIGIGGDNDEGEDKMIKGLKREDMEITLDSIKTLADKYTEQFKEDILALNIKLPHVLPRASEHLAEQVEMIEELEKKGFTYKSEDAIYFDTSKDENYGKLGGLTPLDESQTRVETGGKKSPRDFALWKFNQNLGYPSPWGQGFPGWHIECSAMSQKYLGKSFDIHTGGIDLLPVHHNNEIAQSENACGCEFARYWIHNEFVNLGDVKMAKSDGNILTLSDLNEKGLSPLAYRYLLLQSHYRTPTTFSWESLEGSSKALGKLQRLISELFTLSGVEGPENGQIDQAYKAKFVEKLENDFNTAQALAVLWTLAKDKEVKPEDKRTTILDFDRVLGLGL